MSIGLLQHAIDKIISLLPNLLELEFDVLSHTLDGKFVCAGANEYNDIIDGNDDYCDNK